MSFLRSSLRSGTTAAARIRHFLRDRSGGALPLVALSMLTLIGLTGLGVDSARSYAVKSRLSTALDAASLAGAKMLTTSNASSMALQTEIQNLFNANIASGYLGATISTPQLSDGSICVGSFDASNNCIANSTAQVLSIKATATIPTMIMQIFAATTPSATVSSTANKAGGNNLEVVMVLDNSGSMASPLSGSTTSKLFNLQLAANNLITTLSGLSAGTVKYGVVPFTGVINVGAGYANAAWMDTGAASTSHKLIFNTSTATPQAPANRFSLLARMGLSWGGCVEWRYGGYDMVDTVASAPFSGDTLFVPYFWPDEPKDVAGMLASYNNYLTFDSATLLFGNLSLYFSTEKYLPKYTGLVQRVANLIFSGDYAGPNAGCDVLPLSRLTISPTIAQTEIAAMHAGGDTNLPMGLAWGWHVLSPNAPFADGAAYTDTTTRKFVVMLTDGFNHDLCLAPSTYPNNSIYSSIGYVWEGLIADAYGNPVTSCTSSDNMQAALDSTLSTVCTNMKAAGITIFTVGLLATTDPEPVALEACATGGKTGGYFIRESDPTALAADFATIANQISQLRLSK